MNGMVDLRAGYGAKEFGKAEFRLSRNGENLLHLEKETENRAKHWGAPTRTLHVGSGKRLPAGRILLPTRKQWAAWGGAAAVGTAGLGGVKRLNRDNVKKRDKNHPGRRALGGVVGGAAGTAGALYTHHGALLIHGIRRMARQGAPVEFKDFKEAMHPKQALGTVKEYPIPFVVPGAAGGVAGAAIGGRRRKAKVAKRNDDRRRTAASIGVGAVGGVGATDVTNRVGGWVTREGIKYHEALVNAGKIKHPMSRNARSKRLKEHQAAHGVGSNVNDAPQSYYRNWPKELPGARARQFMGVKNTPKVVAATLTAGGLAGGAYGGLRSRRRKQPVGKAIKVIVHGPKSIPRAGPGWQLRDYGITHYSRDRGLTHYEVEQAYRKANFRNSAGRRRQLGDAERKAAVQASKPKSIVDLGPYRRPVISKSYIPGKGYISASKMPRQELRALAQGGRKSAQARIRAGERLHAKDVREVHAAHAALKGELGSYPSTKKVVRPRAVTHAQMDETMGSKAGGAFALKTGGRRAPGNVYIRPDTSRTTLRHEASHVEPKRSGYRLHHQIQSNPRKLMREEARADYRSGLHYKVDPGDSAYAHAAAEDWKRQRLAAADVEHRRPIWRKSAVANYRHVQDQMRYAGTKVKKVDTTMSDAEASRLAQRYDTRGPLPKKLSRDQKMKAYEARYIASGGRKAEKWKRRSADAEVGRNIGLAGATGGALLTLAARNRKLGPKLRKVKITAHRADNATIGAAAFGGASELYGEHARSRRASYQNSPGGVAASALHRMQAYTPEKRKS